MRERVLPSRRNVLAFFGLLTSYQYFQIRSAKSQQKPEAAFVQSAIREAEANTKNLGALVLNDKGPLSAERSSSFRESEIKTVKTFLEKVHGFSNDDLAPFTNRQFRPYLALAQSEKVELAPSPEEVKPLPAQPVDSSSDDTLLLLLIDIVLDTLDLSSFKDVIKTTAKEYQPFRDVLQQMAEAVRLGDWQRMIGLMDKLIDVILADKFIEFVEKAMGPQLAKRFRVDVLKALTKRLVPFLGWTLLGMGFVFAIRNNWERVRRYL
jgi:hypothetical protein